MFAVPTPFVRSTTDVHKPAVSHSGNPGERYIHARYEKDCTIFRVEQRRSYAKGFERYALDLSRHMTIQDVAHHLNVSWDTIKDIQKRYLHRRFGKTLAVYRSGIIAYYDFDGLSTSPLERTRNKIKTLQKMAYGFLDREFLKLKIKGLHETKYALVG